jgi:hypothetical protein
MVKPIVRGRARSARAYWLFPLAAVAFAAWYAAPSRRSHRAEPVAPAPEREPVEVAAPAPGSSKLVVAPVGRPPAAEPSKPAPFAAAPQAEALSYEAEMAELATRGAFYQAAFEREVRDTTWATSTETVVRDAYPATTGVDAVLSSVECRATLCRLEFSYRGADERRAHLGALAHQFAELPNAAYAYPGEPSVHDRAVAYFARRGAELPAYDKT